jgi:Xaa-Pro aminopeptidase
MTSSAQQRTPSERDEAREAVRQMTSQQAIGGEMREAVLASFPRQPRDVRIRQLMEDQSLDCIVAVGSQYATWLTGYSRYFAGISATVVGPGGETELVTSPDESPVAERESRATRVWTYGTGGFGLDLDPLATLLSSLPGVDLVKNAKRTGVTGLSTEAAAGLGLRGPTDITASVEREMLVKDRDEAEKVAVSYNLCLAAQRAVGEGVAEGASELELFTRAHSTAQLSFGAPVEFISDLLSGPNSAEVCCPIAVAGPRRAGQGEPVVADIAVGADGYWGDTCRTFVHGRNDEISERLGRLTSLLEATVLEMRPGIRGCDLFDSMAKALASAFPGAVPFPHHGGHGIGLAPADSPHVIPADETTLEAGMILAIEPGAYFPGRYGVRVENEYLVTSAGGVELNAALAASTEEEA